MTTFGPIGMRTAMERWIPKKTARSILKVLPGVVARERVMLRVVEQILTSHALRREAGPRVPVASQHRNEIPNQSRETLVCLFQ